jgi:hypothetical protein
MRCSNPSCRPLAVTLLILLLSVAAAENCVEDFRAIHELEATVQNTSVVRKYVICPYRLMSIGYLDFDGNLRDEGDDNVNPPLLLRPNMHILCGETGQKGNLCFVRNGHLHIDGTSKRNILDPTVDNVLIEGFVFSGALEHSLLVTKPGSITFRNCEWTVSMHENECNKNRTANTSAFGTCPTQLFSTCSLQDFTQSKVPIMLDFFDAFSEDELVVTFESCIFLSNRFFGEEAYSALIYGNSDQNRLIIERSTFQNNDMIHNNTRVRLAYRVDCG